LGRVTSRASAMVTFSPQTHQACGAGSGASECRELHSPMPDNHIRGQSAVQAGRSSNHAGVNDAGGYVRRRPGGDDRRRHLGDATDDYLIGTYRAQPRGAQVGASPECAETLRSFCHELPAATTGVA